MREQLIKLQEYYQNQNPPTAVVSMIQGGGPSAADEHRLAMKQWQYCTSLAKYMYQVMCSGFLIITLIVELVDLYLHSSNYRKVY